MGKRTYVNDEDELKYTESRYQVAAARAGVRFGVTRNLGDYNSLVVQFWHEDDFKEGEDFAAASDRIYRQVETKVESALDEYEQ